MAPIGLCLWFDSQAEEAANFYVSVFGDGKILNVARHGPEGAQVSGKPEGSAMTVTFQLRGQEFMALNGGPLFKFTEAISLMVSCATQIEVDHFWHKLSEGGEPGQCGWLKDRYGVSWQIIPSALGELMQSGTPEQSRRVMAALLQMKKLDIAALRKAYQG